jgi:cytosine/adenosine deaminase-related metal-dependent hydrolase
VFAQPVAFRHARVVTDEGIVPMMRYRTDVLSIGAPPKAGDHIIDLDDDFVLPGLINAHDHLELNHYGRLKGRPVYGNACQWIDDMRPRLRDDPALERGQAHRLSDRLFVGGMKNLLSGVTTVAHHNPLYPELRFRFPVKVLRRYGWAHSLCLQDGSAGAPGESGGGVAERFRATPAEYPFLVHLAEGTDQAARDELGCLERLGCLADNAVLIHGVGFSDADWLRVVRRGAGLIWCPASNFFLFGKTAPVRRFLDACAESNTRICLGTDSRVTGSFDLLDELRVAVDAGGVRPEEALRMVTGNPARLLRLGEAGRIVQGGEADLLVIRRNADDPAGSLLAARRRDVRLVTIGGRPLVADPDLAGVFAAYRSSATPVRVDGVVKLLDAGLARRVQRCAIAEEGLECTSCS